MNKEANFYKNEYENMRRKKNKEIEDLTIEVARLNFLLSKRAKQTYDLLALLGMPHKEIVKYYENNH